MYYPILRGRQNELLAIRELVQSDKLTHVVPVIEPVKSSSTLLTTIQALEACKHTFVIVANPTIGSLANDLDHDAVFSERYERILRSSSDAVFAFRPNKATTPIVDAPNRKIAYFYEKEHEAWYLEMCKYRQPDYTFIPTGDSRRRRRISGEAISLETKYEPRKKNADYRYSDDDFLTEEHLFFRDEGFIGFADYSIIGDDYNEGGFMPQVVALHLTYFSSTNEVRIRHFISEDDYAEKDIAGKFHDALSKLVLWAKKNEVHSTEGLKEYFSIYDSDRFPGLGYAKKLSLKHHMEMMNSYLEESDELLPQVLQ
ncbi:MAG: sce7725 family protein [Eggerthellaceae bacterium]|nr:sce7725 family protein [Eggerthellaceae bacterium]